MTERRLISAFGDEMALDLEDQIAALRDQGVAALELRSAWGAGVVGMEAEDGAQHFAVALGALRGLLHG